MSVPPELRAIGAAQIVDSKAHAKAAVGLTKQPKKCAPAWGDEPGACRYFGVDPDGAYCGHPKSLEITSFGCGVNRMSIEGLCTHGDQGKYELWEGRENA